MKIAMTGGGSGGHITPILAVAHEIKQSHPSAIVYYIGQRGDGLLDVMQADKNIDHVFTVYAGKFRRYSGQGWRQIVDLKTQILNIRDAFRVVAGTWQSFWLLRRLRPDVIFTRGGFVSVPVAIGGQLNHIPYITHDSDIIPSLANRLIAKQAAAHAVAFPVNYYPYPAAKTIMVGIPVSTNYVTITTDIRLKYRQELKLDKYDQIIFVTGGGNGAQKLNREVIANTRYLLKRYPDLVIVHVTGREHEAETACLYDALSLDSARNRVVVRGFVNDLYRYSGAADVVVARGGATNIAEFAIQQVACVIVPSPQLSWNVKNNQALADRKAIVQLTEDQAEQPERLGRVVADLLDNQDKRVELGRQLSAMARPDAAKQLADILVKIQQGGNSAVPKA